MTGLATLRDQMIRVGEKARLSPKPERYLWVAVWWHLHARETANPSECIGYAKGQLHLARDMAARPDHYRVKPADKTDWEWSGLRS
jgi:hypothetical protein